MPFKPEHLINNRSCAAPGWRAVKKEVRIIALLLLWCWTVLANAQDTPAFEVRFFGLNEGLSSREIHTALQDRRGMLWVGTSNGLNYFNEHGFELFSGFPQYPISLPSFSIYDLAEDESGNLWICTASGAVGLNERRNRLFDLSELGIPDSVSHQPNMQIESHPQGGFWIFAGKTLYRYSRQTNGKPALAVLGKLNVPLQGVMRLAASRRGQLWCLTEDSKLFVWQDRTFRPIKQPVTRYELPPLQVIPSLGDSITYFHRDSRSLINVDFEAGNAAIDSSKNLDFLLPPWNYTVKYAAQNERLLGKSALRLQDILIDQRGAYWFFTNMGVFQVRARKITPFKQFGFLRGESVRSIFQDQDGALWIGTYNGLFHYQPGKTPAFFPPYKAVWKIVPAGRDAFWLCAETPEGLMRVRRQGQHLYTEFISTHRFILAGAMIHNMLWIGGLAPVLNGLDPSSGRVLHKIPLRLPTLRANESILTNPVVKCMLRAKDGALWIGGDNGIILLKPTQSGSYRQDTSSILPVLRTLKVNALYESEQGQLWIASKTQGLACYNTSSKQLLWHREENGLAHNMTYSILGSHSDSLLWIGTQKGLSVLHVPLGIFTNYFEEDGLAHNEFNAAAAWRAPNGDLYFGGLNGITWFRPEAPAFVQDSIKTFLRLEFLRNNSDKHIFYPLHRQTLRIRPGDNRFELKFAANELFDAPRVSFRYQLSGITNTWLYTKGSEQIFISRLSPGLHTLRIQARIPNGNWGPEFLLYLKVLLPWYLSWWFFLAASFFAGLVIFGYIRFRIARIKREYALRRQVSDDLHDDLGGRLYTLRILAGRLAAAVPEAPAEIQRLQTQFTELSQDTLRSVRNFIWAFNPKNDRLTDLAERMEDYAQTVIRPLIPVLTFQTRDLDLQKKIHPLIKHHTLLAFQEILNNMTKHTLPRQIDVLLSADRKGLLLTIENTCEPLNIAPEQGEGMGIESIKTRLQAIRGRLEWHEDGAVQKAQLFVPKI